MAALNTWQKLDRVLIGQPFGNGSSGSATVSSDPNTRATITGTATQTTGTAGSTDFTNGDVVVLYQTQGTGAGQWEVNKIVSGGGTTSLTFQKAHNYTYGTGAQIIKAPLYSNATISGYTMTAWDGTTGGIGVIACSSTLTLSGDIVLTGKGFIGRAADGGIGASLHAIGEDYTGRYGTNSTYGAGATSYDNAGGGSGYGTNGTTGSGGSAGSAFGTADLTTIYLGAGSGGSKTGNGGNAGGVLIVFAKTITTSSAGAISNGTTGAAGAEQGGSGACGGAILLVCANCTLGTNLFTALGSTGNSGGGKSGGNGGDGRIAVHHSATVTGTTNPTFNDTTDNTLVEANPSFMFQY